MLFLGQPTSCSNHGQLVQRSTETPLNYNNQTPIFWGGTPEWNTARLEKKMSNVNIKKLVTIQV